MKSGIELITEERKRQIEVEGWTAEHDSIGNNDEQLASAAACYACPQVHRGNELYGLLSFFPWDRKWWKPTPNDRVRELSKAGALIAAEIDRLNNIANNTPNK